jgi:hypothetical protein
MTKIRYWLRTVFLMASTLSAMPDFADNISLSRQIDRIIFISGKVA